MFTYDKEQKCLEGNNLDSFMNQQCDIIFQLLHKYDASFHVLCINR